MEQVKTNLKGLRKMENELLELRGTTMKEVLANLADARDKGDISENAEYDIAKEDYDNLLRKIGKLSEKIQTVILIDSSMVTNESVQVFTNVKVFNKTYNLTQTFSIVPETDIDIKNGKISMNSPIAMGLQGKKISEVAQISVPAGTIEMVILEITI
jgi:transcription elongation factor GreA